VQWQKVWGNNADEPCYSSASYAASNCLLPYKWNLDYVVDVHGNTMSWWYQKFTTLHGSLGSERNAEWYDRDALLTRVEYGTREGAETATAPAKMERSSRAT
jgi:hypothetical protein